MKIDYTVQIWREGSDYIAHALPIDVVSAGPSVEEARSALDEAVEAFVLTAREKGTLQEALEECGYVESDGDWYAPEWVSVEHRRTELVA